jgi:hypothetical protein
VEALSNIGTTISGGMEELAKLFSGLGDSIDDVAIGAAESVGAGGVLESVGDVASSAVDTVKDVGGSFFDDVADFFSGWF